MRCGASRIEMRALPELEHEQTPQPVRMVGAPFDVIREQALDGAGPELAATPCTRVEQRVSGEVAQLRPEPVGKRHAESGLAPLGDLLRQVRREGTAQGLLAPAALRLQLGWQRDAELEHLP